ncbi:glycoside hydrolase family 13 protein [Arsenicicoccus bolidensis]|uniref:glycoside hydrolase family 13 protein n=1 Tax=Arsenicicoccus bolidensis TaxID=229480 RepID=UPI0028AF94E4|nr:glycoside hydrolase family 13 protein [Arsenicicoccus bolidensis]
MTRALTEDTVVVGLLDQPHHDGSPLYVSTQAPALGQTVQIRLRVPAPEDASDRVTTVHVRTTPDGESRYVDAVVVHEDEHETWWQAEVVVHNPVTGYRFLLSGGPAGYQWLNGTGLHDRDVPDAADFRLVATDAPPPEWALDAVVYQVFPDRFARSAGADARPTPEWAVPARWEEPVTRDRRIIGDQLYGGDLDGIREHLDHLERLGVDVLYLTPFFPGRSNHRYDADTFQHVDPLLGGDDALARLTLEAHRRGLRVLGDFTTNHTGARHEWFETAVAQPDSPERGFYLWDDDGGYVSWLGVPSLPKLNYDSDELWRRVLVDPDGVVRRWLAQPYALDGWRVDVANMTGRHGAQDHNHAVAREMRRAVDEAAPGSLLVGEHVHDFSTDIRGDGWHGAMNYAGFTRPVWTWLRDKGFAPKFLGSPLRVPRLGGEAVRETVEDFMAQSPWTVRAHSFTLLGSHDTTRVRTLVGEDARQVVAAAGLLLTMPGIPMITYGDEVGMEGDSGEDGRRPMPWDESCWDTDIFEAYQALVRLRVDHVALRRGGLRWVHADGDSLTFLREHPDQTALVLVSRGAHAPIRLSTRHLPGVEAAVAAYGTNLGREGGTITLDADGPGVSVWVWPGAPETPW